MLKQKLLSKFNRETVQNVKDEQNKPSSRKSTSCLRWYVLFVASLISFEQGWVWNTYGPIARTLEQRSVFNWDDDAIISTMRNSGPIFYMVGFLPTVWMLDKWDLRPSAIVASAIVCLGCGIRLISTGPTAKCRMMQSIGMALNGLSGPFAMSAGTLLSAHWFPRCQRTTATALYYVANILGTSASFLVGPIMVPSTGSINDVRNYLWVMFSSSYATTLLVITYFPSRPPRGSEPSKTSGLARLDSYTGLKLLLKNKQFWLLAMAYGVMTGVYAGWEPLYALIIKRILDVENDDDDDAQAIGDKVALAAAFAGIIASLVFSGISDAYSKQFTMRSILLTLSLVGTLLYVALFVLIYYEDWIHWSGVFTLSVLAGASIKGSYPLFFEAGVEAAYPVSEGLATLALITLNNVACMFSLLLPEISYEIGTWVLCASAGSCLFSVTCLFFFRGRMNRCTEDLYDSCSAEEK